MIKSADTVLFAIDIDLQCNSRFLLTSTSSLVIFPKGAFTLTFPCCKRVKGTCNSTDVSSFAFVPEQFQFKIFGNWF